MIYVLEYHSTRYSTTTQFGEAQYSINRYYINKTVVRPHGIMYWFVSSDNIRANNGKKQCITMPKNCNQTHKGHHSLNRFKYKYWLEKYQIVDTNMPEIRLEYPEYFI